MRNLFFFFIFLLCSSTIKAQNPNLKLTQAKGKYQNFYFKSPQKYNNKAQEFRVIKIEFSTSFKDVDSKNKYQILITGKVKSNNERILYNAKNLEELKYYQNIFRKKYKKVLLTEYSYFVSKKKYYDTSISVEF